jgi:hypothetical protein
MPRQWPGLLWKRLLKFGIPQAVLKDQGPNCMGDVFVMFAAFED